MRSRPWTVLALLACTGCPTNIQQHAAFASAEIRPGKIPAAVGDVVRFEVIPDVPRGSEWLIDSHGRARFVIDQMMSHADWVAAGQAIPFEAIVSPWDPQDAYQREATRGWLWFGLKDSGANRSIDRDLPIDRLPFREIGAVTVTAAFSLAKREPRLSYQVVRDRMVVSFQTPISQGFPYAPRVKAMLLETGGKKRLYAEVWMNYGDQPKEPIGYEVTVSYPAASITDPLELVVVEWLGHGWYYGPFEVHRTVIGGAAEPAAAGPAEASAPPAPSSTTVTTIPAVPAPPPAPSAR